MARHSGLIRLLLALAAMPAPAPALPAPECVRLMRQARIADGAGEVERAVDLLNGAAERCPDEAVILQELLRVHLDNELSAARSKELRRLLLERVTDSERPLAPGSVAFLVRNAGGDRAMLEALLESVRARLESDPDDLELLKARATLEGGLGLRREARATLGTLIRHDPSFLYVSRAVRLDLELEEWQSALELVEPWIDDERFGVAVHKVYLARLGDSERVMAGLRELRAARAGDILSDGGHLALLKRIAWGLYDAGETGVAEDVWRQVLAEAPGDFEATRVVANLFATEEERRRLSARLDRQVDELEDPNVMMDQAVQFLATGDHRRAYDLFARLTDAFGDKEDFWFNYGVAAIALEEWQTAARAFAGARELNAGRSDTHFQLAKALRELGRCGEAIEAMRAGLALDPDRWTTYYYLAQCYSEIGEPGEAALAMEEYRKRKPE